VFAVAESMGFPFCRGTPGATEVTLTSGLIRMVKSEGVVILFASSVRVLRSMPIRAPNSIRPPFQIHHDR
jgi:hypothetical protein